MKQDIILNQIDLLTNEWNNLVHDRYHKRYDTYFCIKTIWEYGNKKIYILEHHGNLFGNINQKFETYDKAVNFLYRLLKVQIKKFKKNE
jgi:hypothetical protein